MSHYKAILKFAVLIGCLMAQTPVLAEHKVSVSRDSHRGDVVEARSYPWSAIGKLNNGTGGSCTAVMISQKYALTAAHCLFYARRRQLLPAQSLHLVLGYENQNFEEHFHISAYYIPPAYDAVRPYESLAHDWALLRVSSRNQSRVRSPSIRSFKVPNTKLASLMTAGYSQLRPYLMTADRHCRLLGRSHDNRFLFDTCRAPAGYSGAPLIVYNGQKRSFSIAGIHVANQLWRTHTVAIAIPIDVIWPKISPCVEHQRCQFQVTATGKDPTAEELLADLPDVGLKRNRKADASRGKLCSFNDPICETTLSGP